MPRSRLVQNGEILTNKLLERLLAAAEAHGRESEADHEVGDLQGILATCWKRLTAEQRREVYDEHRDLIEEWGPPARQV